MDLLLYVWLKGLLETSLRVDVSNFSVHAIFMWMIINGDGLFSIWKNAFNIIRISYNYVLFHFLLHQNLIRIFYEEV